MKDELQRLQELGLGSRLNRLSVHMMKDIRAVYEHFDIDFDPFLFPIFKMIIDAEKTTTTAIQDGLQYTQPAITQGLKKLEDKGLVAFEMDKSDKRKKIFAITAKGKALHLKMKPLWKSMDNCVKELTHFSASSLTQHIFDFEQRLAQKSLKERILAYHQKTTQIAMQNVTIENFKPEYAKDFARLNVEWLEKYFEVEPHDAELLERCEETIINKNGYIFCAKLENDIVGTAALIQMPNGGYELGKMAVSPKNQGLKIGQQLMRHCLDFAESKNWKNLILYSNRMLENAIYIYKKYGFKEIPMEENPPYERSNIKMEYRFNAKIDTGL